MTANQENKQSNKQFKYESYRHGFKISVTNILKHYMTKGKIQQNINL